MILNILKTAEIDDAPKLRKDFFEYMFKLDKARNQNLLDTIPLLKPLYEFTKNE